VPSRAVDAPTGQAERLSRIVARGGRLSGQAMAWVAQWGGLSFN
jgi:hypothetical protein